MWDKSFIHFLLFALNRIKYKYFKAKTLKSAFNRTVEDFKSAHLHLIPWTRSPCTIIYNDPAAYLIGHTYKIIWFLPETRSILPPRTPRSCPRH